MRRYRVPLAAAGVGVLVLVGFWFFVYQPRADTLDTVDAEAEQLTAQQQTVRRHIARLEAIAAEEERVRADLRTARELVPADVQQPALLARLQEAADAADVSLDEVTLGEPQPVPGAPAPEESGRVLAQLPVTLTLEGDYFALVELFRGVETDVPRAVLLDNVHLTEGEGGFPALSGVASGRAYSLMSSDDPDLAKGGQASTEGGQASAETSTGANGGPDETATGGDGA